MPKSTASRLNPLHERQARTTADLLSNLEQPFNSLLDFSICEGRQLRLQDSESHRERIASAGVEQEPETQPPTEDLFPSKPPQATKQSRQVVNLATQLSLERHAWKQTGEKSSLWVFERRWPHRRDHAEGRNHGVQGR
jgi:hypothetical protein